MSLNDVVSAERVHIGFFGMRNAGKSSLVNAVTGQPMSVVSEVKGTTTDPVKKAMELLPLGPVLITDTPGLDDEGGLGEMRVERAQKILAETDIAVLVADGCIGLSDKDRELIELFKERKLPYIIAYNKSDAAPKRETAENEICVSALTGENIKQLKDMLGRFAKPAPSRCIIADLLEKGDTVVLVMPIDAAAPKGRLILPQQMTLREVLDYHCSAVVCQDTELADTLANLKNPPKLVVTDSQAFGRVSAATPESIQLTSFSILMARYKGELASQIKGAAMLSKLHDGDKVLISEGCTHHRQCGDIGSVKIPAWIEGFSKSKPVFEFSSGNEFPSDLSPYKLIVHCGACMVNEAEMRHRVELAVNQGVPIVNFGIAIAHTHGILRRSLEPFPEMLELL